MNKKILSVVLALSALLNTGAYAAYNKYNEEDAVNVTNFTVEEAAAALEMTYEDLKKTYNLPEDMPGDTNEAVAFGYLTIENFAKLYEENADEIVKYINENFAAGAAITKDTLWKDAEASILLKDYVEDMDINEFKTKYLSDTDINDTTFYTDVKNQINRALIEEMGMLKYFKKDSILVMVNGKYLDFDVAPTIINERTMVPLRGVFENMGATVSWDGDTKTVFVNKDDTIITLQIGLDYMFKNTDYVELDSPAQIVDGRTLVPLRAIAEAIDTQVFYNPNTKTVVVH